jgi:HD-GYP domain-containing protein (c-di-GMP phosphodiesterase class II)
VRRRATVAQLLAWIADGWYSVGPVVVLLALGGTRFSWSHWPVYLLALAAQFAVDWLAIAGRTWFAERIPPRRQPMLAWAYLADLGLSSVGLLAAAQAAAEPASVLLVLPLIGLLVLFARERTERLENTLALSQAYRGTALLLGDVIERDDEYTGLHSRSVVQLAIAVAARLELSAGQRQNVEFGALLHDVGKLRIPDQILHKPGPLDAQEWEMMRRHTIFGEELLRPLGGLLSRVGTIVRHSHERYDGHGYPDGLAGEEIPIESRIVSACDAWSAMTTDRPYRRALSLPQAAAELRQGSGRQFDPIVTDALLRELGGDQLAAASERGAAAGRHQPEPGAAVEYVGDAERALALHGGN